MFCKIFALNYASVSLSFAYCLTPPPSLRDSRNIILWHCVSTIRCTFCVHGMFPEFNIRLYDKTLNHIIFFCPPPRSEYFFHKWSFPNRKWDDYTFKWIKIKNKNETLLVNVSYSTVKNIFENGMIPKLIQKRPSTLWNIYFGPIEQTVCPNTTGGDKVLRFF
jgi:hypothetical protein